MLGPMNVSDTAPEMQSQVKRGVKVYPLTNLQTTAIKVHLYNQQTHAHKFGMGSVTFLDQAQGTFAYWWHSLDTNTPGLWDVWVEIIDVNGKPLSSTNIDTLQITNRVRGYAKNAMGRVKIA